MNQHFREDENPSFLLLMLMIMKRMGGCTACEKHSLELKQLKNKAFSHALHNRTYRLKNRVNHYTTVFDINTFAKNIFIILHLMNFDQNSEQSPSLVKVKKKL